MSVESKIRDFLKKGKEIEESLQLAEEVNELEEKLSGELKSQCNAWRFY